MVLFRLCVCVLKTPNVFRESLFHVVVVLFCYFSMCTGGVLCVGIMNSFIATSVLSFKYVASFSYLLYFSYFVCTGCVVCLCMRWYNSNTNYTTEGGKKNKGGVTLVHW